MKSVTSLTLIENVHLGMLVEGIACLPLCGAYSCVGVQLTFSLPVNKNNCVFPGDRKKEVYFRMLCSGVCFNAKHVNNIQALVYDHRDHVFIYVHKALLVLYQCAKKACKGPCIEYLFTDSYVRRYRYLKPRVM